METVNQHKAVVEQYKTPDNLNARISIHAKYSTNKLGFGNWLFSHYDISPDSKILELGCGTGEMWRSRLDLLDKGICLTLTDLSENMVLSAKNALGEKTNLSYATADIERIPYKAESFDIVIANMMLYHVPDLKKGLSEVQRVLKNDGYFYCATYGENGIIPFLAALLKEYGVTDTVNKNFTLQNGYGILSRFFSSVRRFDYEDSLAVTDIDDLLDYIYSLSDMSSVSNIERKTLKEILEKETVNGVLHIPKEYGMFICRK